MPAAPIAPSACSSSELLPTPGSPPTSTSDPGTSPPPSTRSSSPSPVGMRAARSVGTSDSGRTSALITACLRPGAARTTSSTSVFHSPHSVHRPIHFGLWWPQDEQV